MNHRHFTYFNEKICFFIALILVAFSMCVQANEKENLEGKHSLKTVSQGGAQIEQATQHIKQIAAMSPMDKEIRLDDISTGALLFEQGNNKRFVQAPQLKTTVDINVKGIVANVTVKQKFTNVSNDWQHALYAFPLPENSAVNQLKIIVADRVIIGKVQEKQKAIKSFNHAKKTGRKSALVEQYRPNLFTTKVANIPPHEEIEVELTYFQQVDYQAGEFSLHFPMTITPRYTPKNQVVKLKESLPELIYQARNASDLATELALQKGQKMKGGMQRQNTIYDKQPTKTQRIDLTVNLSAGAKLAQINSVNHTLTSSLLTDNSLNKVGNYHLSLIDQVMDKDFTLTWKYPLNHLPQTIHFQQPYQDEQYGLLMILPGLEQEKAPRSRELSFLLDTSGSMAGQSLKQAKEAFNYALTSLNENDSFQLISFNSYPTKLFPVPVAATSENKAHAMRYVNNVESTGGTEIMSALSMVLEENSSKSEKLEQIVFLTDGAVGNEAEIFSYIANNINNKRLFTVGLGGAPNRYFMKKAAEIGRGSYQFISNPAELVQEMKRLFSKLSSPVLTDLTLSVNNPKSELVTTPSPIPDIYQGEPLFLSYQIKGLPTDTSLSGLYKGQLWSLPIVHLPAENRKQTYMPLEASTHGGIPPLATLWARRKIADHFRELMLYKKSASKVDIINLALKYNLVTAFTSLVAVEEKVSRDQYQTATEKQLNNNLPAGQKLPSTALNWQWRFYIGLILFVLSVTFMCAVTWNESRLTKNKV